MFNLFNLVYFFNLPNLVFIVLLIILFSRTAHLRRNLEQLKSELAGLKGQGTPVHSSVTVPQQAGETVNIQRIVHAPVAEAEKGNDFVDWFKENPLLKIGVLMIIIGFGWFVSYAFAHNWIGPVGRITLGVLAGTIVTLFGTWRLGKDETQGIALTVLGSALMIISLVAGTYVYHFFGPTLLLLMVFAVSLYVSLSAVAYSSKKLGVYGILISMLAPLFSNVDRIPLDVLYIYLGVVSISTIWIAAARKWEEVISVGVTGILLYSLPYIAFSSRLANYPDKYFILFVVYLIAIMYLVFGIWHLIRNKESAESSDVYLAVLNTAIILGFTVAIVQAIYQSLVIAVWMIVYAISGFFVFNQTNNEKLFYIHSLISVLLLAVATSIELSGQTLVIAYAIEISVVSISAFLVTNNIKISEKFSMLFVVPFIMSLESISSRSWDTGVFHSAFAVLFVLAIVLAALGFFYKTNDQSQVSGYSIKHIMFIVSTFYIYTIIWLSNHSIINDYDTAVFVSLFIYTIVGLATHFYGLFNRNEVLKKYGMAVLILVVGRLVIVDVWGMDLVLRVITFIVLGVMFMSSAFISKKQNSENNLIQN